MVDGTGAASDRARSWNDGRPSDDSGHVLEHEGCDDLCSQRCLRDASRSDDSKIQRRVRVSHYPEEMHAELTVGALYERPGRSQTVPTAAVSVQVASTPALRKRTEIHFSRESRRRTV